MSSKKINIVYEIVISGEGHPLLERSIEEVFETVKDCLISSLPGEKETITIVWRKKSVDKA